MIPRKNERTSNRLASPWTWVAASMMVGGLAMMATPAEATTTAPAAVVNDGFGGGFGGIGGFGQHGKDDETVDLFSIWQADD